MVNRTSAVSTLLREGEDISESLIPRRSPTRGGDDVEGALLRAYKLIESTMTSHRRRTAQRSALTQGVELETGEDVVEHLVGLAKRSIGVVLSEHNQQTEAVCSALEGLGDARRKGLAVRLLCTPQALGAAAVRNLGRRGPAPEIRVAVAPVQESLIVDGRLALVPADGQSVGGRGSTVQDPAVVRVLESLFAGCLVVGHVARRVQPPRRTGSHGFGAPHPVPSEHRTHGRRGRPRDGCLAAHLPASRSRDHARARRQLPLPGWCEGSRTGIDARRRLIWYGRAGHAPARPTSHRTSTAESQRGSKSVDECCPTQDARASRRR